MREAFKRVFIEFEERGLPELVKRELIVKTSPLTAIVGPRRAGKTYYFFQLIKEFGGVPNCLYVDFEHELLAGVKGSDLGEMLTAFRELYGRDPTHIFLDEVQAVPGWERFVRRLRDSGKYKVFVTGSSSKLLAREVATQLRGRAITYFLLPFSFREYLRSSGVKVDRRLLKYSDRARGEVLHHLSRYLSDGGFPELVLRKELYDELLHSIVEGIFYRDLVDRFRVRRVSLLDYLMRLMARRVGKEFTITRIHKVLRSAGLRVSKATVMEYLNMMSEVMLFFYVKQLNTPLHEALKKPRKTYVVDNSLLRALGGSQEPTTLLENAVFLELLRMRNLNPFLEINYWREAPNGPEVDFVLRERAAVKALIQVTYRLTPENEDREMRALLKASRKLECGNLLIITWDQEETLRVGNKEVKVIPFYEWVLGNPLNYVTGKQEGEK